jgi:hypothetical protein
VIAVSTCSIESWVSVRLTVSTFGPSRLLYFLYPERILSGRTSPGVRLFCARSDTERRRDSAYREANRTSYWRGAKTSRGELH